MNDKGFITIFYAASPTYIRNFSAVQFNYKYVSGSCGSDGCYDYIRTENESFLYRSFDIPFRFEYLLNSNSTTDAAQYRIDSTVGGYTSIGLAVNTDYFSLPGSANKLMKQLDSISLNKKIYHSVFQLYLDSATRDETLIKPHGIYYDSTQGLIGFYLTNGETWALY